MNLCEPNQVNIEYSYNFPDDIVEDNVSSSSTTEHDVNTPLWAHYNRNSRYRQSAYNEDESRLETLVAISYLEDAIKSHNIRRMTRLTNEDISNILHWYFILNNFSNTEFKRRIEYYFRAYYS
mgnify:CR=1 FL=1